MLRTENISFTLKTDRDCFLTIFTVDSAGAITTLLPNKDLRELHLGAGQECSFRRRILSRCRSRRRSERRW